MNIKNRVDMQIVDILLANYTVYSWKPDLVIAWGGPLVTGLEDNTHWKVAILKYVQMSLGNWCLFLDLHDRCC